MAQVDSLVREFKRLIHTEPFEGKVVEEFMELIADIYQQKEEGTLKKSDLGLLQKQANLTFPVHTMHGHAVAKPRVYPGDFELIDKIYTQYTSHDTKWALWDKHFHSLPTFIAVRNRKAFFQRSLEKSISNFSKNEENSFRVLQLLSGSCRPIKEFLQLNSNRLLQIDCVEVDRHAIQYASGLLGHLGSSVRFYNQNIFRFKPEGTYHYIWAGGLFNYLDDKLFAQMIRHIANWLTPRGKFVLGIVTDRNPNRDYLEVMFDWRVYHRNEEQLHTLVKNANLPAYSFKYHSESQGAIGFVEIQRK